LSLHGILGNGLLQTGVLPAWWTCGGLCSASIAYQPKGAASLALSYKNLANPGTNDAFPGTAPTWDAVNGWKFDAASSMYLRTGQLPEAGAAMLIQFTGATIDGATWLAGGDNEANARFLILPNAGNLVYYGAGGIVTVAPRLTAGNLGIASPDGGAIGAFSGTAYEIYIGADNKAGTAMFWITANVQAFAYWPAASCPTAGQILIAATAMAAL
jgi:hypothetical protein